MNKILKLHNNLSIPFSLKEAFKFLEDCLFFMNKLITSKHPSFREKSLRQYTYFLNRESEVDFLARALVLLLKKIGRFYLQHDIFNVVLLSSNLTSKNKWEKFNVLKQQLTQLTDYEVNLPQSVELIEFLKKDFSETSVEAENKSSFNSQGF